MDAQMIDSRIKKMVLSPEDTATHRQWRLVVCAFYASVILMLVVVCGVHHFVMPGGQAQVADGPRFAPVADAGRGEPATLRR
jgi:hypothetical protein